MIYHFLLLKDPELLNQRRPFDDDNCNCQYSSSDFDFKCVVAFMTRNNTIIGQKYERLFGITYIPI